MLGWRTPPLSYSRGVCNKPVAQLIESNKSTQDRVLLVSDSNARNLVQPQVKNLIYSAILLFVCVFVQFY